MDDPGLCRCPAFDGGSGMINDALDIVAAIHFSPHEQIAVGVIAALAFLIGRIWPRGSGDRCSASMFDGLGGEV